MDMSGTERIAAPVQAVWEALNDPLVLKDCIPGCETLEKLSATEMAATVVMRIGPVKARFQGTVELADLDPPRSYTIRGEGKGGIAGFAKGSAGVTLSEDGPDGTILAYTVKAEVGGKIAQLGSRLIDSTARKLAAQFFSSFGERARSPSVSA